MNFGAFVTSDTSEMFHNLCTAEVWGIVFSIFFRVDSNGYICKTD